MLLYPLLCTCTFGKLSNHVRAPKGGESTLPFVYKIFVFRLLDYSD